MWCLASTADHIRALIAGYVVAMMVERPTPRHSLRLAMSLCRFRVLSDILGDWICHRFSRAVGQGLSEVFAPLIQLMR